nr:MAG TPA: hypothetical protein [Caudoviricetes sp.]
MPHTCFCPHFPIVIIYSTLFNSFLYTIENVRFSCVFSVFLCFPHVFSCSYLKYFSKKSCCP